MALRIQCKKNTICGRNNWYCCCCLLVELCPTLCDLWATAHQATLSFTVSQSLLKFMSIESMMTSNHLSFCPPLLLLPSISSRIGLFSNELILCIRWSNYQSFSFSISPSNEYLGLISFRIHWFYLFVAQGTLKSLLQHHSLEASIL